MILKSPSHPLREVVQVFRGFRGLIHSGPVSGRFAVSVWDARIHLQEEGVLNGVETIPVGGVVQHGPPVGVRRFHVGAVSRQHLNHANVAAGGREM